VLHGDVYLQVSRYAVAVTADDGAFNVHVKLELADGVLKFSPLIASA
jgi:hypothetical protein